MSHEQVTESQWLVNAGVSSQRVAERFDGLEGVVKELWKRWEHASV